MGDSNPAPAGRWTQVDIHTTSQGAEPVGAALMDIGLPTFSIQDPADFESLLRGELGHWDYIDDDLMQRQGGECIITVYLPENRQGADGLRAIEQMLARLRTLDTQGSWGTLAHSLSGVQEEDWATAWKQYYKPMRIGKRLVVCPSWEEYSAHAGDVVLRLDPGMAFGTGTHESTRLCLELLEGVVKGGEKILDVGCGSGVLAIGGLLLGASGALGIDIDEVAVRVAAENAALNGLSERASFQRGSLGENVQGNYDIICANIVADVIISFTPQVKQYLAPDGHYLVSGIIDSRREEVLSCALEAGFRLLEQRGDGGWLAFLFGR